MASPRKLLALLALAVAAIAIAGCGEGSTPTAASLTPDIFTFSVGTYPSALAYDGESIWVGVRGSGMRQIGDTVVKLARDGTRLGRFLAGDEPLGAFPAGIGPFVLAYGGQVMWVANFRDHTVSKIALSEG